MPDFDRVWTFKAENRTTGFPIFETNQTKDTRIQFSVTVVPGVFLNFGTIKIFNLPSSIRSKLHYRTFEEETIGKGPKISLKAGYETNSSVIFNGAIYNSFSIQEGVDVVTTLEVGIDIGDIKRQVQPSKKEALTSVVQIAQSVKDILKKTLTFDNTLKIPFASSFESNAILAITQSNIVALSYSLSPPIGTISQIIEYLNKKLNIRIYLSTGREINVAPRLDVSSEPFFDPLPLIVFYSSDNDGFGELVIGSPYDYISGVKFRSFLNPSLKLYQKINFRSKFIKRTGSIVSMMHSGDTRTNEWYTEIDMANRVLT
jgi:hypothetical protein